MGSYLSVVELITKRVRQGDYALSGLPGERELAADSGVSYMTARKAVRRLIEDGVLVRHANGRVEVNRLHEGKRRLSLAFLAPTFASADIERWRLSLDRAAQAHGAHVRPVLYVHWDDPLVLDSLTGFDGVFLVPINEAVPDRLRDRFAARSCPLVVLDEDWSHLGIPSISLFPPALCHRLLEHFVALGRTRIDCLNVQPESAVIAQRIAAWRAWVAAHGCTGELINAPIAPYVRPLGAAYEAMRRALAGTRPPAPALLAVTLPAAVGAIRALHERGFAAGRDVVVGAINGEEAAAYQVPSITALEAPDAEPYFARCLAWMAAGGGPWTGPLLMRPDEVPLAIRESTVPRTDTAKPARRR
jgi:LacI family transcriptional regulator